MVANTQPQQVNRQQKIVCPVCGQIGITEHEILWPELISAWEINEEQVKMINRQQGECCQHCKNNLRSRTIAGAIMEIFDWDGTFQEMTQAAITQQFPLLEINEAGTLHPYLQHWAKYDYAAYPEVDMQNMPYHDGSFFFVIHSDTLEHVPDPVRGLQECYRVLRPNGCMVMTIPIIHDRITRRRDELVDSFHGNSGDKIKDMKVITEYGADFYIQLIQAGWKKISLFTLADAAAVAVVGIK